MRYQFVNVEEVSIFFFGLLAVWGKDGTYPEEHLKRYSLRHSSNAVGKQGVPLIDHLLKYGLIDWDIMQIQRCISD